MQTIPLTLAPFFQEYDIARLNTQQDSATIIERALRYGSRLELHWLFEVYSRAQIAAWIQAWGRQALPEPHLSFWRLVLEIE